MRRTLALAAAGLMLLSLSACATGGPMSTPNPSASSGPSFERPRQVPTTPPGPQAPVSAERWDGIVADLAARGVSGEPELVSAEAVTWNSGALGCPKPGRSYTQALVEGMRVVVTVEGTTYDYRFGRSDSPVLCEA